MTSAAGYAVAPLRHAAVGSGMAPPLLIRGCHWHVFALVVPKLRQALGLQREPARRLQARPWEARRVSHRSALRTTMCNAALQQRPRPQRPSALHRLRNRPSAAPAAAPGDQGDFEQADPAVAAPGADRRAAPLTAAAAACSAAVWRDAARRALRRRGRGGQGAARGDAVPQDRQVRPRLHPRRSSPARLAQCTPRPPSPAGPDPNGTPMFRGCSFAGCGSAWTLRRSWFFMRCGCPRRWSCCGGRAASGGRWCSSSPRACWRCT